MKTATVKTERILLSDGRRGTQTRYLDGDKWILTEVVITQEVSGKPCRHVYGPRRFLQDSVFSFADLGNVTWEIAPGAK